MTGRQLEQLFLELKEQTSRLDFHDKEFERVDERTDSLQKQIDTLFRDCASLEGTKFDTRKAIDRFNLFEKDLQKLRENMAISDNHLTTVECYIEKYLPVRVNQHIIEYALNMFPKGTDPHIRVLKLQAIKSKELHDYILTDNGRADLLGEITAIIKDVKESKRLNK